MPRRPAKTSSRAGSAQPAFMVSMSAGDGAPSKPSEKDLRELFHRAWMIVPPHRRPDVPVVYLKRMAIDLLVMNDKDIAALNAAHLKHQGPTDVLSFPMGEIDPERRAYNLGEIVVSFETAQREATARRLPPEEELARYCVHGFLHLLGYEDETKQQREAMFAVQEEALATRNSSPPKSKVSKPRKQK